MEGREKLDFIGERLIVVKGFGGYPFTDMIELCLVADVVIPPKFKVPDFDKYKGTTCPKNHLNMYCWKMGEYFRDEKLLMHFFQESLAGAAVIWYTCHTIISSEDDHLQTFGFLPAELSCLTPIIMHSVRFFDISEGNVQNTQKEGKRVTFGEFFNP